MPGGHCPTPRALRPVTDLTIRLPPGRTNPVIGSDSLTLRHRAARRVRSAAVPSESVFPQDPGVCP
eukprot:473217-Hanusia_phi.AAC.2